MQCFNDFLQALKSKVEDKALADFWEILIQGMMAFKKKKNSSCIIHYVRENLVSNGTLTPEQHFDMVHSCSLFKKIKKTFTLQLPFLH